MEERLNSPDAVVVVSDSHIGAQPGQPSDQEFLEFLRAVPELGSRLVINGDLFDFWFEYGSVIPRRAFPTLAGLAAVRESGVDLVLTGGNHDRWGGAFWREELGARFEPEGFEDTLCGIPTWIHHGDGLSEQSWRGGLMHSITRHPITVGLFRMIHPNVGFWLVGKLYGGLREGELPPERKAPILESQRAFAEEMLKARDDLELVILSHTHHQVLHEVGHRKWFLNPGVWQEQLRYAIVRAEGPELRVWDG